MFDLPHIFGVFSVALDDKNARKEDREDLNLDMKKYLPCN